TGRRCGVASSTGPSFPTARCSCGRRASDERRPLRRRGQRRGGRRRGAASHPLRRRAVRARVGTARPATAAGEGRLVRGIRCATGRPARASATPDSGGGGRAEAGGGEGHAAPVQRAVLMGDDIARLSRDLERIDSLLADIAAERKLEEEALALIESDLSNTVEEFVADTQRSPEDYPAWRRKAKL